VRHEAVIAVTESSRASAAKCSMAFKIFRELENGEVLEVATHGVLEKAEALVQALKEHWPGIYVIREIENDKSE